MEFVSWRRAQGNVPYLPIVEVFAWVYVFISIDYFVVVDATKFHLGNCVDLELQCIFGSWADSGWRSQ